MFEGKRRPEPDHASQGGREISPELSLPGLARRERGGVGEHRPEASGRMVRPAQENEAQHDQQRRFDAEQQTDGVDPPINDPNIQAPEEQEAEELGNRDAKDTRCGTPRAESGKKYGQNACRSRCPRSKSGCRTIRKPPARAARRAHSPPACRKPRDSKRETECRSASRRGRSAASATSTIALPRKIVSTACHHVHAATDERRGEHVGRNTGRHGNPQRRHVPRRPGAAGGRHGGQILVRRRGGRGHFGRRVDGSRHGGSEMDGLTREETPPPRPRRQTGHPRRRSFRAPSPRWAGRRVSQPSNAL